MMDNYCYSLFAIAVHGFSLSNVCTVFSVDAAGKFDLSAINIHLSCLSIRCKFQSCVILRTHRTSFSFQLSNIPMADTTVRLKQYSITAELLFASCREITLLLFSGTNFDNCS